MNRRRACRDLPDVELQPVLAKEIQRVTEQAEQDIKEARVNFRWGQPQIAAVKHAASLLGVPYQTYIKHVVLRQALNDIRAAEPIVLPQ